MKDFEEIREGQILFLADESEFYDHDKDSQSPDGMLPKHTKIKVDYIDGPEVFFKIMEGEFKGRRFMWGWYGDSEAKPEELLTEEEFALIVQGDTFRVDQSNVEEVIQELSNHLSGIKKQRFSQLIEFLGNVER
ncbi:hypothetical protein [Paenibacillus taichungensis]|jgi:hypothetical protein